MAKFVVKDVEMVYMAYEYIVDAESEEEAVKIYEEELVGTLDLNDHYVTDASEESITASKYQ